MYFSLLAGKSEPLCTERGLLIISVIIGVLLIGAAIAIGSTFALIKASNSTTDDADRFRSLFTRTNAIYVRLVLRF